MILKDAKSLGPRNRAPQETPKSDPMIAVMEGILAELKRERATQTAPAPPPAPITVEAPKVEVHIPDRPKRWLFKVDRNTKGDITEINAEAIE